MVKNYYYQYYYHNYLLIYKVIVIIIINNKIIIIYTKFMIKLQALIIQVNYDRFSIFQKISVIKSSSINIFNKFKTKLLNNFQ